MKPKRPKLEPIHNPTLFQMEKQEAAELASQLKTTRPYSLHGILLGTSAFTAAGWEGSFYPKGMRSGDYLAFYAEHFHTVEVDSTLLRERNVALALTDTSFVPRPWEMKEKFDFVTADFTYVR